MVAVTRLAMEMRALRLLSSRHLFDWSGLLGVASFAAITVVNTRTSINNTRTMLVVTCLLDDADLFVNRKSNGTTPPKVFRFLFLYDS